MGQIDNRKTSGETHRIRPKQLISRLCESWEHCDADTRQCAQNIKRSKCTQRIQACATNVANAKMCANPPRIAIVCHTYKMSLSSGF